MLGTEVMSMDAKTTGQMIAQRRKEKGMTQRDLAQQMHVTTQAVSKWERGLNFPDIAILEPLAQVLGLTVSQLLSGSPEEQPAEQLVTQSLSTFHGQWRRSLVRWHRMFGLTAVLLVCLLLAGGYWWVKEYTEWLPRQQTLVCALEVDGLEELVADVGGRKVLLYNVTLADDVQTCRFQLEMWTHEGQVRTYAMGGLKWTQDGPQPPRNAPLVFSYELELDRDPALLEFGLGFCGVIWESGSLEGIPNTGHGVVVSGLNETTVVPEWGEGVVLACFGMDTGRGYVRSGPTGVVEQPRPEEGEVYLLLRMYCA